MTTVFEISKLFLHMGIVAFGGPAAHIAMIHKEVVDKRKWMSDEHFMDLVGATALIPGPNSTEMVIHCGFQKGGVAGLWAAGVFFLLPACILTGFMAHLYVQYATIPQLEMFLFGIKPVVIILIFDALRKLFRKAIKSRELLLITIFVFGLCFAGVNEAYALFVGAIGGLGLLKTQASFKNQSTPFGIFWVFLKIGSILFGSGYALVAYLQAELVDQRGWLTTVQLADAIAIGQLTPGPVLSTATFVGYLLGSTQGAALATLGIFLPSFLFVFLLNPWIPKMRASKNLGFLLDSLNAGSLGLMAYALIPLSTVSFTDFKSVLVFFAIGGLYLIRPKMGTFWWVGLGSLGGALLTVMGL